MRVTPSAATCFVKNIAASRPVTSLCNMTSGAQLFSNKDQASAYAKYRPTYPDELYEAIYGYAGPPEKGVALDVAAGAIQSLNASAAESGP